MIIPIKTDKDKIFEQYLHIINPVLNKSKLSEIDIKVLSKLLQIQCMYAHLGDEICNAIIFNKDTKKKIREAISKELVCTFTESSYNNSLLRLRKKGFIDKDKIVHKAPYKDKQITITYSITLAETDN